MRRPGPDPGPIRIALEGPDWWPVRDFGRMPAPIRRAYWRKLGEIAVVALKRQILKGIGADGRPLAPVKPRRGKYRGMTGPPLAPGYDSSRSVRLLAFGSGADGATLYWRAGWGRILGYHARRNGTFVPRAPKRDVIGLASRRGLAKRAAEESGVDPSLFGLARRTAARVFEAARGFFRRLVGAPPAPPAPPPTPAPAPTAPRPPRPLRVTIDHGPNDPALTDQRIRAFFGPDADRESLGRLFGGVDGARVEINFRDDDRVYATIRGVRGSYEARRTAYRDPQGRLVLRNDEIRVKAEGHGLGTRVFGTQVDEAIRLGFDRIETVAARSDSRRRLERQTGYVVWPKLGYDGPIPMSVFNRVDLPPSLAGATRVSDLMRTEEGRRWWTIHGDSFSATFDLRDGSLSRRVWAEYLRQRAARPAASAPTSPPATSTPRPARGAGSRRERPDPISDRFRVLPVGAFRR